MAPSPLYPSQPSPWPRSPNVPFYLDAYELTPTSSYRRLPSPPRASRKSPPARSPRFLRVASPVTPSKQSHPTISLEVRSQLSDGAGHRTGPSQSSSNTASPMRSYVERPLPPRPVQSAFAQTPGIEITSPGGSDIPPSNIGLGISHGLPADTTRTSARSLNHEKYASTSSNFAQDFEKRIWEYNKSNNVIKQWLLEIISWLLSALCMGAIVVMLLVLKDQKLPRWPLGLTLNAFIAVLSKVSGAALLLPVSEALGQLKWSWFQGHAKKMWDFEIFDNASRGPWGSVLLLIRTKGRDLAALGAAVTVLSLALEPFFQQVVDFPDRWVLNGHSSLSKVTRYEPHFDKVFMASGLQVAQVDMDLQVVAQKYFYGNGTDTMTFGNGTRAEIPVSCPTSNCTWPVQETLGVCSACADVSYLLEHACLTTRIDWIANITGFSTESSYPNGTVCGYWLNVTSDSPTLLSGYNVDAVHALSGNASAKEALLGRTLPLIAPFTRQSLYNGSIHFQNIRNPIVDVLIAGNPNGRAAVMRNETPIATECVLSWCVKTFKSSYYWANYEEEILKTQNNETEGPYPWIVQQVPTGFVQTYTDNITLESTFDNTTVQYGLTNDTAVVTIRTFDEIFPSWTTQEEGGKEPTFRFKYALVPMLRTLEYNPWVSPGNISIHMQNLATALTNQLRSSSSKETIQGQAFNMETFVDVRWAWLSLPLALLLFSFIFLLLTIVKTSREAKPALKTSAIATLLYGLPDDLQNQIKSSTLEGTPRTRAKELRVKLVPKGWRISGNLFSPSSPRIPRNQPPPGWI